MRKKSVEPADLTGVLGKFEKQHHFAEVSLRSVPLRGPTNDHELRAPIGKTIVWGSVHQSFFFLSPSYTVGQVPLAYLAYPWTVTYKQTGGDTSQIWFLIFTCDREASLEGGSYLHLQLQSACGVQYVVLGGGLLGVACWVLEAWCWVLGDGLLVVGCWVLDSWWWVVGIVHGETSLESRS